MFDRIRIIIVHPKKYIFLYYPDPRIFQKFSRYFITIDFPKDCFSRLKIVSLRSIYTFAFSETIKRAKRTTRIEVQGSSNKASNQAEPVILIA